MGMQEEFRPGSCFPIDAGAFSDARGLHRLGPKGRRDRGRLFMKNSILYCIGHPDCACGGLCIDASPRMTPRAAG
jgi:hypothetical protein